MWEYAVVAIIVGVAVFVAVRSIWRTLVGNPKSACGCSSGADCSSRRSCSASVPLVNIKANEQRL